MKDDFSFQSRIEMIEELVERLDQIEDEQIRRSATELVQFVMELHRSSLERLLGRMKDQIPDAEGTLQRLVDDEMVSGVLLLHGLHPVDFATRVDQALEKVRPALKSHGGNVELVSIEDGIVHLRLEGHCHRCPSSEMTLKTAIENVFYEYVPDMNELKVDGVVRPQEPGFIPIDSFETFATERSSDAQINRLDRTHSNPSEREIARRS